MTRKTRELSPEERRLWRRVAEGVKPRKGPLEPDDDNGAEGEGRRPGADRRAAVASPSRRPPSPPKTAPPADRGRERRVQRGQVEIDYRLDLHGYTHDAAMAALQRFVQRAHADGARVLLVITGNGRGGEGVLKRSLPLWLAKPPLSTVVAGVAKAHRSHGGAGAAYLFLRRKPSAG